MKKKHEIKKIFESLYEKYNQRKFVHPDPLEFVYLYDSPRDKEIVGLIASALAYGRVKQILVSVNKILSILGESPVKFVNDGNKTIFLDAFANFKHRFTDGVQMAALFNGIKRLLEESGTIENAFATCYKRDDITVLPALQKFSNKLYALSESPLTFIIPNPAKASACKRMNLYLRWMVRSDNVDPGGWSAVPSSSLIIPLDTHIFKIGKALGFTQRKQANLKTAIEITNGFKNIEPFDPIKYDFALTRPGIRQDKTARQLLFENIKKIS